MTGADGYLPKPRAGAYDHLMAPALRFGLTGRELEVPHRLADGHDKHTIATSRFMAPKTVAKRLEYVLTEVPARSRAEAVAIAWARVGAFEPGRPGDRCPRTRATGRAA